ncbi:PTS galactosamine/N-acetylgalactosamine transporter subunit IIA [uncultured Enterococcus sp.]|uniref:PTS galactosamine/N-acetylgalactosamine transporter subunit IIA n=1 Tax=uncultured Enterococcus sp. TaxID=167972 RepID=UPI002AA8980D|nr:PTS galactosamine/N-acetylgalactosamine transporter subunit IIA [uncultured Enterococcus sp.]
MIGCILTGHGSFAPGMMGAVEMIAGPQEFFEVVPFHEEEALEVFEERITQAVEKLSSAEGIVIFTDLLGGTPFRTAMLAAADKEQVQVIAGTNLPLLIEGSGLRHGHDSVEAFIQAILTIGKEGLVHATLDLNEDSTAEDEEEGI